MGCFESREENQAGKITFVTKDDFEKDKLEHKYVAVDCSKTDADYKFQRIPGAVYFSISEWIKKDKNGKMFCQTPTVEEFAKVVT
jgi:3-mercaptopyruvate sulfurtransferase SseA